MVVVGRCCGVWWVCLVVARFSFLGAVAGFVWCHGGLVVVVWVVGNLVVLWVVGWMRFL